MIEYQVRLDGNLTHFGDVAWSGDTLASAEAQAKDLAAVVAEGLQISVWEYTHFVTLELGEGVTVRLPKYKQLWSHDIDADDDRVLSDSLELTY